MSMISTDESIVSTVAELFSGPLEINPLNQKVPEWRPIAWLYALVFPVGLYVFEAIRVVSYPIMQAPSVSLVLQLAWLFVFFSVWIFVPRAVWVVASRMTRTKHSQWSAILLSLGVVGLMFSLAHALLGAYLTTVLRSRASWELPELSSVYGNIWLGCIGNWFVLYSLAVAMFLLFYALENRKKGSPTRCEIKQNGKTVSVAFQDIYWVKATGDYVELHTVSGVLMARKSLSQLARDFGDGGFIKSHRSALVNSAHVISVKRQKSGSGYTVQLANGDEAPLARRKLSEFKDALRISSIHH